jgi:hypothetical protein
MTFQKVEYQLINEDTNRSLTLVNDPRNWDEAERTLKRSEKTFGVISEFSRDLEFTGDGATFLREAYLFNDIEARVKLKEYRFHPKTDIKYLHSTGVFDFSEYASEKAFVTVPFKSGGLNALISSNKSEKFELERLDSIDGVVIDELQTKTVALTPREILLQSNLSTAEEDRFNSAFKMEFNDGNYRALVMGIPVSVNFKSDEKVTPIIKDQTEFIHGLPQPGTSAFMFYFNNDLQKTLKLKFKVSFKIKHISVNDLANSYFSVQMIRYTGGLSPVLTTYDNVRTLHSVGAIEGTNNKIVSFETNEFSYTINEGDSLALVWSGGANFGDNFSRGDYEVDFLDTVATVDIEEASVRAPSQSKAVLFKDVGEKIMQVITGRKSSYVSDFYNNGDFKLTGLTTGLWVRRFLDSKIQTSFKDFIENSNAIHNTGWAIDIVDNEEVLVHEDLRYFFQNKVAITLGRANNIKRYAASDLAYSSLIFGYKKPSGEILYEEAQGLDEYNLTNGYTTPITRTDNEYDKESPYRADSYGKEFARRKLKEDFPNEDTRYDKNIFNLDLKYTTTEVLSERLWQDDYEVAPKNIFSPNTATGLRLTPFRNFQRHEWFLSNAFTKFTDKKVRYSNTRGNSELITKKAGEVERAENGNILVSDMQAALFVNQWIEFEHEVDFYINEQVYGRTEVAGRSIPNFFFKVQFINELNKKERGFLFELKPNKEGFWKLLKAL